MHISFSLAVTLLLTPVLGSLYPRDAYERLHARSSYYAELEARQAYQKILAREAYAHPDPYGHALGLQPRRVRARGTPSRIYTRRRLRARMPPPPASTLTSLPEGLREGGDTPPHSDASGSRAASPSRITSPFAGREAAGANARGGQGSTSEIEPHPDQGRGGGDPPKRKLSQFSANRPPTDTRPPDRHSSGTLRTSGGGSNGEPPRRSSIRTSTSGAGRPEIARVSIQEPALRKSASTSALGSIFGSLASAAIHKAEGMMKGSSKRKRPPVSGTTRANSLPGGSGAGEAHLGGSRSGNEGGGSPTASRASKSTLHSAGSSPGAHHSDSGSDHRGQMGDRPRPRYAKDGARHQKENEPPAPSGDIRHVPALPSRNGSQRRPGSRPRGGARAGGSGAKKGKHPHLERPPKRLTSTKPWNAAGLGITAVGAGVAGGAGVWSAIEAQKGATAAVLSAQAGLQIANASMKSADAGVKGANAAALSAQAGMKGSDAAQLSAEAGMKSANAAMISAQTSIKSANGTQLIGAVQLATAANNPNITNLASVVSDVQAGRIIKGSAPAPDPPGGRSGGGAAGGGSPVRKRKRSYPPAVFYYEY
ncbi:hypothetical protein MMC30_005461 [Trapelia coarctata]|nr:hypothetical protein [Trapelia coarctata]